MTRLTFRWGQELCPICLSVDGLEIQCLNCQRTFRRKGLA